MASPRVKLTARIPNTFTRFRRWCGTPRHECRETRDGPEKVSQYVQHDLITAARERRRSRRSRRRRPRRRGKATKIKFPTYALESDVTYRCINKMHSHSVFLRFDPGQVRRFVVAEASLSKCHAWKRLESEGWWDLAMGHSARVVRDTFRQSEFFWQ